MRAFTVRQPWAWAIIWAGKNIENRRTSIVGSYQGVVAVHAGLQVDADALSEAAIPEGHMHRLNDDYAGRPAWDARGAIVGVVEVLGSHQVREECRDLPCWPWGALADTRWHIELGRVRALAEPVPCRGRPGLWTLPDDVAERVGRTLWEAAG
jgi:hypothetical protein